MNIKDLPFELQVLIFANLEPSSHLLLRLTTRRLAEYFDLYLQMLISNLKKFPSRKQLLTQARLTHRPASLIYLRCLKQTTNFMDTPNLMQNILNKDIKTLGLLTAFLKCNNQRNNQSNNLSYVRTELLLRRLGNALPCESLCDFSRFGPQYAELVFAHTNYLERANHKLIMVTAQKSHSNVTRIFKYQATKLSEQSHTELAAIGKKLHLLKKIKS